MKKRLLSTRLSTSLAAGLAVVMLGAGASLAADLPKAVADSGTLRLAIAPNYPPMEFRDPATNALEGFDVDLASAIAGKLGVKVKWEETSFSEMLSALKTGRIDGIMSGMSDLPTRHDTATFIDYLKSGPQFFVRAEDAAQYPDVSAVCGKKVGASRRTSYPKEIAAWSDGHCAGNPVTFVGTEGSADARNQLKQHRIDVAVQGNETLPYVMQQTPGTFHPIGKPISYQYTGLALPMEETGFQKAVAGALDALIADGSYGKLLDKWHLTESGVKKAHINGED
ncbi:ABC transporter substrate-binding protein [Acidimangrovimonas sediminis]|uniref:ABC transporter substrate-binding protein n=1 Tax=Acidimangrovimonas sediminis TaxID=2056283 RepID=UPI000C805B1F|nr:ABC transporter substrate-binding protein [Acidimangrovimonas sediminis]